jgi:hypothetical protein
MKLINRSTRLLSLLILLALASCLSACKSDDGEEAIIPKSLEQYKLEMTRFVASEKAIVEKCVVGYNKGDFKSTLNYDVYKAGYLEVLVAAQAVLGKVDVTIAEIVNANKTLTSPGKAFDGSLWISDRRPLNDAIAAAETLDTATLEGNEKGQAPTQAKTAFAAALTVARNVRGASTTIDRQVTEAVTKLEEAKQVFLKAIVK